MVHIDIAGTCNLRCPSCPTGNARDEAKPVGFMPLERFSRILAKIAAEMPEKRVGIALYDWGEPLLHPQAAQFIEAVRAYPKFWCAVSSNLSLNRIDLEGVVRARPHWFRVSLSGFFQETYGRSHRRGDIELVKANMRRLREEMTRQKMTFPVEVAYHLYKHNAGDDLAHMKALCQELKFTFRPMWASFYPLEKVMDYVEGDVSDQDLELIELLAIRPRELLAAALPHKSMGCALQTDRTVINHDGTVQLCDATYTRGNVIARDFLEVSQAELMATKSQHPTCTKCLAGGYHAMMVSQGVEAVEPIANARIAEAGSDYQLNAGKLRARPGALRRRIAAMWATPAPLGKTG